MCIRDRDKPYYKQALPLLDEMLAVQSAEVDTVSGATLTAEGLIGAVEDALGKAAGWWKKHKQSL